LECGGKRSATPLWNEQPEQPATDFTDGTDSEGMGESRGRETTKYAKSAKERQGGCADVGIGICWRGKLRLARIGEEGGNRRPFTGCPLCASKNINLVVAPEILIQYKLVRK